MGAHTDSDACQCLLPPVQCSRYDNHQEVLTALARNSKVDWHLRCGRLPEEETLLPIPRFRSYGRAEAVTVQYVLWVLMQVRRCPKRNERQERERIMVARTLVALIRLALVGAALSGGINLAGAQTVNPQTSPAAGVQAPAQSKSAKAPKKMRGTTNEMRRAAAVRNAERQAAHARKHRQGVN